MRLKSRLKFVPKGFQLLLPEIGMAKALNGSFNQMVDAFANIVAKNPALAQKQGWPTNRVDQENWLDERECRRMIAHGWADQFVNFEAESPPIQLGGMRRSGQGGAVAAASKTLTGLAIYKELFSGESNPVDPEEAERRAAICVKCPLNHQGSLYELFVQSVAKGITELYGVLNDKNLKTSRDKELGTCAACSCPVRAKVHCDLETILRHTKPLTLTALHSECWITHPPAGS